MTPPTFKQQFGCWINERWRTEFALRCPTVASRLKMDWRWLCNRHEKLVSGDEEAVCCDWKDSSLLTVARTFPNVGSRLLHHSLHEWPLRLAEMPENPNVVDPKISVVLPVGGKDRIPLFQTVVKAFFGQTVADIELIAVEQAIYPEFESHCPSGVRYLFIPREEDRQFNKSLAMNVGVKEAKAPIVLLHDADVVPPASYVKSILGKIALGWEAVRPIRFALCLDSKESVNFQSSKGSYVPETLAEVHANFPGLSTAVTREAYWRIGGHDESFEGWGGEDWEFFERLQTLRLFRGSYCPAIHLWHAPAPKKQNGDRNNTLVEKLKSLPREQRIADLRSMLQVPEG